MAERLSVSEVIAKLVSVVFHPLLMPTWSYVLLINFGEPLEHEQSFFWEWVSGVYIFLATFLIPSLVFVVLLKLKFIGSFSMPDRHERNLPILITAVFFYLSFYLFQQLGLDAVFGLYMLGATVLALISMLINYWWKISLHLLGVGGLTGAVATLALYFSPSYFAVLPVVVLLSGLIAFSRLKLKAHSQAEVYVGYLLGLGVIFGFFAMMMG
jgi:hypothetical protein